MEAPKSQSEFLLGLFLNVFSDLSLKYPSLTKSFLRDMTTIRDRVAHEGVSFLTKSLPKLGKHFERSLETSRLSSIDGFKKAADTESIPAFLQGMISLVFDLDGSLRIDTPSGVILDIRQVLFLAYRVELPYSKSDEFDVIFNFKRTESELKSQSLPYDLTSLASMIVDEALSDYDPKDILPRHGPGSVATGELGDKKWKFSRLYDSIHQQYPYYDYYIVGKGREIIDRILWYRSLDRQKSGEAKVILVPKDSRGPRLISCEPLEYQWIQQGIGRKLANHLERVSPLTKGRINFSDQSVNQKLALTSSKTKQFCTIDLKDASDRVTVGLVKALFPKNVSTCLLATRTAATKLPDGEVIHLEKFAPMGSALCFPVESLVFWAIAVASISYVGSLRLWDAAQCVYVYGDDIIVPTEHMGIVVEALESCSLKVNREKSFGEGWFRESCGMDAYNGEDVTPIKIRTLWSGKPLDGSAYVSYVSYANSFASRGYNYVASYLWTAITNVYGKVPYGTSDAPFPCKLVNSKFRSLILNIESGWKLRFDANSQSVQIRTFYFGNKESVSTVDGWPRLLKYLMMPNKRDPSKVALPRSAQFRRGWRRMI